MVFMKYELLSHLFYKNKEEYEKKYNQRIQSEETVFLGIDINGYEAFVVLCPDIILKMEKMYYLVMKLGDTLNILPLIAQKNYINNCLMDEIMLTNDIEGIHSTRQEVAEAIEKKEDKKVRFSGLAKKYVMILNHEEIPLNSCADIRDLYDQIVLNEVDEKDQPDGKIFRKGSVSICTATEKQKHKGVYPETQIIICMEQALSMLKNQDIPALIKTAVFHYVFGYIHPFYDGNGRMVRFISSYQLTKQLGDVMGISLSRSFKNNKSKYYKAFDICNNPKNKGDLTPFVLTFLDILVDTVKSSGAIIQEKKEKLDFYLTILGSNLEKLGIKEKESHQILLSILIQNALFSSKGITMDELTDHLMKSKASIKNILKFFNDKSVEIFVEKMGRRNCYRINLESLEKL